MFNNLISPAQKLISDNATTILTSIGVTGTVATGVLAAKAGYQSAIVVHTEINRVEDHTGDNYYPSASDKAKLIWPEFIPAVGAGTLTIGAILFSHKMNAGRAATLAATYSASKVKFEQYRDKVANNIGPDEESRLHDEAMKQPEFVYMGGEVLFLDGMTGRYFQSTIAQVRTAENTVNHEILNHGFASLGVFYSEIDLPDTDLTEDLGWNADSLCEIALGSEITPDGKPCIVLSFVTVPHRDYR